MSTGLFTLDKLNELCTGTYCSDCKIYKLSNSKHNCFLWAENNNEKFLEIYNEWRSKHPYGNKTEFEELR